jgi:hypothetical protein
VGERVGERAGEHAGECVGHDYYSIWFNLTAV